MVTKGLVTLVTPCLNMAPYIARTIESVLSQDYDDYEYIFVDGGSSDGTVDILRAYASRHPEKIRLVVGPDDGVADALNRGLRLARGEYFAYINADDTYFPGALRTAVHWLEACPDAAVVYGNAYWVDEKDQVLAPYPVLPFSRAALAESCYICQPAAFLRTESLRRAGGFDTRYDVTFDYELWLRLSAVASMLKIDSLLANSRMHRGNKTLRQRSAGLREACRALRRTFGYVPFSWAHSYASYLVDGRDQFFEPLRPSFTKYVAALLVGTALNLPSPLRFWGEWYRKMSPSAFVRRWNDTRAARRWGLQIR